MVWYEQNKMKVTDCYFSCVWKDPVKKKKALKKVIVVEKQALKNLCVCLQTSYIQSEDCDDHSGVNPYEVVRKYVAGSYLWHAGELPVNAGLWLTLMCFSPP